METMEPQAGVFFQLLQNCIVSPKDSFPFYFLFLEQSFSFNRKKNLYLKNMFSKKKLISLYESLKCFRPFEKVLHYYPKTTPHKATPKPIHRTKSQHSLTPRRKEKNKPNFFLIWKPCWSNSTKRIQIQGLINLVFMKYLSQFFLT